MNCLLWRGARPGRLYRRAAKRSPNYLPILSALLLAGCAAQGPPQPPRLEKPEPITDLAGAQIGRGIEISFTLPRLATDGERLTKPLEIEIFRSVIPPGQTTPDKPPSSTPWVTLGPEDLARQTRGDKIVLTKQFSDQEFRQWSGATLDFWARGVTRGLRHRPIASELSNRTETGLLDVSGPVERVEIIPQEKALELRWSAPPAGEPQHGAGILSGYRIYKSSSAASNSLQLIAETSATTYVDRNFEFNHTYRYKVRAVFRDKAHIAETADSQVAQITPRDIFPPQAPRGLSGIYTGTAVELIWTANSEADLGGYNVYRREAGGSSTRLNRELIQTPVYRDGQAQPGRGYFYRVTAVDLSNNQSQPSAETEVQTR